MKMLYKYPQAAFPYDDLVHTNAGRGKDEPEYELIDTGVFAEDRYFDVFVEYAKAGPDDIFIRINVENRGPEAATLHVLPTLWFRNTWSWDGNPDAPRPNLEAEVGARKGAVAIRADHDRLGRHTLVCDGSPELLFTENETNAERISNFPNRTPYVKDGVNNAVVHGLTDMVNPARSGTKAVAHYPIDVPAGGTATVRLRLAAGDLTPATAFDSFEKTLAERIAEANAFYGAIQPAALTEDEKRIQRQAFAGLLWSKQFFYYDVATWLRGDAGSSPPPERLHGRNSEWRHLSAADIISMPDKWEYPWFASWDLAFHCVPLALVDTEFAKQQLMLMCREWYQHPNGQLPAYEWNFGDVNPPVLPWAAGRVYRMEQEQRGTGDHTFLSYVFQKLSQNFTWWVNRKDPEGNGVFEGGFLGLDNIGVFDRSAPLPSGVHLEQSDGTSWMAMYCIYLLAGTLELARNDPAYEELATKYIYHFMYIAAAMEGIREGQTPLWDDEDKFFYDVLHAEGRGSMRLKVRSMVGLIPLYAVATIDLNPLRKADEFRRRIDWFVDQRPALAETLRQLRERNESGGMMLSLCRSDKLVPMLQRMLDEGEFLSPYGVRALSRVYAEQPYRFDVGEHHLSVEYLPGESNSGMFGGNSNWRGPIWMPVNYLLVESLRKYYRFYGDDLKVECPTGSGRMLNLDEVADELSRRLIGIFSRDEQGRRAVFGGNEMFQRDPHWCDYIPFYEYFHGDTGRGVGASHQTGWTALVASLLQEQGERRSTSAETGELVAR